MFLEVLPEWVRVPLAIVSVFILLGGAAAIILWLYNWIRNYFDPDKHAGDT